MVSSHDMTRRELPRVRSRLVRAIAWKAPGTTSGWNATCRRRCPPVEQFITAVVPLLTVQTSMRSKKFHIPADLVVQEKNNMGHPGSKAGVKSSFTRRCKRWCTSIVRTIPTPEKQVAYLHFAYLGGGMRDGARPAFLRTPADGDLVALCAPDVGLATAPRRTRSHRSPASPSGLKALARPETLFGSHAQAVLCDL
jgi:hypothetical protein